MFVPRKGGHCCFEDLPFVIRDVLLNRLLGRAGTTSGKPCFIAWVEPNEEGGGEVESPPQSAWAEEGQQMPFLVDQEEGSRPCRVSKNTSRTSRPGSVGGVLHNSSSNQ